MPRGAIRIKVKARQGHDETGRFLSAVETGAHATAMELGHIGANAARAVAPERTGRLISSINSRMIGALSAEVSVGVPYAHYQEEGTGPKGAPGQFLTNREDFWAIAPVAGTPATHFMRHGAEAMAAAGQGVLDSNMP